MKELIDQKKLLNSGVVANNRMNRGRGCLGGNSYQKELKFDPFEFLKTRLIDRRQVSWLDIACGEGRALIEAATLFASFQRTENLSDNLQIIGIDLAGMFQDFFSNLKYLRLLETSIEEFNTSQEFDLITCVHGLHYIGDKLSVIRKSARALKEDGLFTANLELENLKLVEKQNSKRIFADFLRKQGFTVNTRKHLLNLNGKRTFEVPFDYAGADDQAGANSTGQPVVDSYYTL